MSSTAEGITAFVRLLTLNEDRRTANPRLRNQIPTTPRVEFSAREREFYSYGRHFPLARFIPAKSGRRALWLINGDRWGGGGWSLTNQHQEDTRRAIAAVIEDSAARGKTIQSLIVPFSALDGAGIERDSIRPLHVRADRRETFENTAMIPRRLVDVALPSRESAETSSRNNDPRGSAITAKSTLAASLVLDVERVSNDSGLVDSYSMIAKLTRSVFYRGFDYSLKVRHECGVCHGTSRVQTPTYDPNANAIVSNDSPCPVPDCQDGQSIKSHGAFRDYDPPQVTTYLNGSHDVRITEDGIGGGESVKLTWQTERHWLGDSLFSAERVSRVTVPCPNHTAADGGTWCQTCGASVQGSGRITTETRKRQKFLSSFDYNERSPLYFLAALPASSRAKSVDMAFEDLAPPAVHAAYARGLAVKRQGDIFLVPTPLTDSDVYARAKTRARLHTWSHNGNPRAGEVSYNAPLPPAAERARIELRRSTFRASMAEYLNGSQSRPHTPKGWKHEKREILGRIAEGIARHERRIAAGENVCKCSGDWHDRIACGSCGLPSFYDRYSVENAERGLIQKRAEYAAKLTEPRYLARDRGYVAKPSQVWNTPDGRYLTDGNRARAAYTRAVFQANDRYAPMVGYNAVRRALTVHGTGHTATEVVVCKGGVTYVRGRMSHRPDVAGERRDSDHAPLALDGARWYLTIRNTVPRQ